MSVPSPADVRPIRYSGPRRSAAVARRPRQPLRPCEYLDFHADSLRGGTEPRFAFHRDWIAASHYRDPPNLWGFKLW